MRSHYCGVLSQSLNGETVHLCGWVHRRRNHGGVIFIDLRDREGIAQLVFAPEQAETFALAEKLRSEYVLQITGEVRPRPEGTINPDMPTGQIEVAVSQLIIVNESETPPFHVGEYNEVGDETRLRYRYIDLRRPEMLERLRLRAAISRYAHGFLDQSGFIEVETPCLTKATPEGARDYLVPSRTHTGQFFALPQSPQIFKQLLMVGGLDRYYQIVRCFRDEDLRADRQPEFTQIDIEMSFMDETEIMSLMESMIVGLFQETLGETLPSPLPQVSYAEAIKRFGTDRPDCSIPLELIDIVDLMQEVDFKVFAEPAKNADSRIVALRLPGGASLSRKAIDGYTHLVGTHGAKGLAYIKINDREKGLEGLKSPILKFLPESVIEQIIERTDAQTGDILFFGADKAHIVNEAMGALRVVLGEDHGLKKKGWFPLWVVDFPLFDWDETNKRWQSLHHPFTAPCVESPEILKTEPGSVTSRAYDLVLNGYEVGGGSVRIHNRVLQETIFELLGMSKEESEGQFAHLLEALNYGCPPHGGIAFGLDRLAMLMAGTDSIREVIAFPKTQTAACPLTSAPTQASARQLTELGLRFKQVPKE